MPRTSWQQGKHFSGHTSEQGYFNYQILKNTLFVHRCLGISRGVAQLARASVWGTEGRWFESSRPDQKERSMSKTAELSVDVTEIVDNQRYGLILQSVELGLKELGVKDVSLSPIKKEDGRLVFTMSKKEVP